MERINTDMEQIAVEIDGEEYLVAAKTVGVADQLMAAQKKYEGKPVYQLWLGELEILLGRAAMKRLFSAGSNENIDRIQMIHAGVLRAFDHHSEAIEAENTQRKGDDLAELARSLAPLNELLRQLSRMQPDAGAQMIRRP